MGLRGYAPLVKFWNITCCNGYFSAFWTFFRQALFKVFDPNSEYVTKYDAFCSHIFNYACWRRKVYCYRRGLKLWKNCIYQKYSWKRLVRWIQSIHTPHPTPLDPPLAISYKSHQKSLAYFSSLSPLVFFTKRQSQKEEGGMAQCLTPKYVPGAMSLVIDQMKTVVEGVLRVRIPPAQWTKIINGRISKSLLALFQAVFCFINEARVWRESSMLPQRGPGLSPGRYKIFILSISNMIRKKLGYRCFNIFLVKYNRVN